MILRRKLTRDEIRTFNQLVEMDSNFVPFTQQRTGALRKETMMEKTHVIRNRWTNKPIFAFKCESSSLCVQIAVVLKDNLTGADLTRANLYGANLTGADLTGANLYGADLDFSCFPLWCGSLKAGFDDKHAIQILYHLLSVVKHSPNISDAVKHALMRDHLINLANKFHRIGEIERIKK